MPPKEEKPELTEEEKLVMAEAQALKVRGDDVATRGSQRSIAGGPSSIWLARETNASDERISHVRPPRPRRPSHPGDSLSHHKPQKRFF